MSLFEADAYTKPGATPKVPPHLRPPRPHKDPPPHTVAVQSKVAGSTPTAQPQVSFTAGRTST